MSRYICNIVDTAFKIDYIDNMANNRLYKGMDMFIRNLDTTIVKNFKAAVALDGLTGREVVRDLIKKYGEQRLAELKKEGTKK